MCANSGGLGFLGAHTLDHARSKGRGAAATSWIRDTRKRSLGHKAHAPYHPADRETRTAWWSKNKAHTPYHRPSSLGERRNDPGIRRTRLIPSSLPRKPRQLARDAPSAPREPSAPRTPEASGAFHAPLWPGRSSIGNRRCISCVPTNHPTTPPATGSVHMFICTRTKTALTSEVKCRESTRPPASLT